MVFTSREEWCATRLWLPRGAHYLLLWSPNVWILMMDEPLFISIADSMQSWVKALFTAYRLAALSEETRPLESKRLPKKLRPHKSTSFCGNIPHHQDQKKCKWNVNTIRDKLQQFSSSPIGYNTDVLCSSIRTCFGHLLVFYSIICRFSSQTYPEARFMLLLNCLYLMWVVLVTFATFPVH